MNEEIKKRFHIAVFYYTQTGQLLDIIKSVLSFPEKKGCKVTYKEIVPERAFAFPWSKESFYEAFPESRAEIPVKIKEIDFSDIADADLVILGYQPWFLAPSIPFASFIDEEKTAIYLKGKKVITVVGSRNMWISSHMSIKRRLDKYGCNWCGNIALEDRHNNYISVLTIFRWLIDGQKCASKFLPAAGVSEKDIASAAVHGDSIYNSLISGDFSTLQKKIIENGGAEFHPQIYFVESNGNKLWGKWATFVLEKGGYGDKNRAFRLKLFKYYLLTVIFAASPFGLLFFYLTYPFKRRSYEKIGKNILFLQN